MTQPGEHDKNHLKLCKQEVPSPGWVSERGPCFSLRPGEFETGRVCGDLLMPQILLMEAMLCKTVGPTVGTEEGPQHTVVFLGSRCHCNSRGLG